jgi:hypothetical protein
MPIGRAALRGQTQGPSDSDLISARPVNARPVLSLDEARFVSVEALADKPGYFQEFCGRGPACARHRRSGVKMRDATCFPGDRPLVALSGRSFANSIRLLFVLREEWRAGRVLAMFIPI